MKAFNFVEQKCTMVLSMVRAKLDSLDDIKLDLESKLKTYSRKFLKSIPSPTFKQTKNFLEKGEL